MSFTPEQIKDLSAPLSSSHVKERTQAGRKLSYIESWRAISEANRIFGFDGWHSTTRLKKLFDAYRDAKDQWRVGYMAKVTVAVRETDMQYVTRDGVGYGSGIDRDLGQAHESAIKEAESDARKRALMTFGNPFGLALYDKDQTNVTDDNDEPKASKAAPASNAKPQVSQEPEPKAKNAPGISGAQDWVRKHLRNLHAAENPEHFLEMLNAGRGNWVRVCASFPSVWTGADGSGLRGEALKVATIFECRPAFDEFAKGVEADARESNNFEQQAAE